MAPAKRQLEYIDLTQEDDGAFSGSSASHDASSSYRAPKLPRTGSNGSRATAGSSQQHISVIGGYDDEDEEDWSQEVLDASQSYSEVEARYIQYGTWENKIVGCRFYSGIVTKGEFVMLRREPQNPYDCKVPSSNDQMRCMLTWL